ncbi:ATP-binding protein [Streptomyces yaanensis]|uniref:ATP-binding protein n=1 Tax=Streptomyces yaanensis TaxID=1142239 RepID=A0ABV7S719_9ACTN|nr:ATP-binding protein [Streptomyces sp. CGMCC 4.7035]WNC00156.1 ATP-binding protein [Streptomyces sp. CGMCC 4.7035]
MTGGTRRFRMPWHRRQPAAAVQHVRPQGRRHVASVRVGPDAVREARERVAGHFTEAGIAPESAFADAVLLVVSELVTNVLRHAPHSPVTDVGITVVGDQLVVSVADTESRLPDLTLEGMGAGLRMVAELAADYDGELSAEPAVDHEGKVVLVRFEIPL